MRPVLVQRKQALSGTVWRGVVAYDINATAIDSSEAAVGGGSLSVLRGWRAARRR